MPINLDKSYSINEIGARSNNEDTTQPKHEYITAESRLFMVCDGVGGSKKGEIASALACESIQDYFDNFIQPEQVFSKEFIDKSVRYAEIRFDDYIKENPSAQGMATTLCLVYFSSTGVYLAHAGDSRIYQIRDGEVLYKTEDHSLVNTLLLSGQITKEDAKNHPQKNVILRAIQGSQFPVEMEVNKIEDVLSGDQFFICTDGILEALSEEEICSILNQKKGAETKLKQIKEICSAKSKDNFSAYLIPVQNVSQSKTDKHLFATFLSAFM
ncbi:protein phosphatase [Bacteroidales bacterium]|nr:protein phosphatase [Bacteroidales bacterium]